MLLTLYNNKSDKNVIGKDLTENLEITSQLKEETSLLYPAFIVKSNSSIFNSNYLQASDFGRFYYIKDIKKAPGGVMIISCEVDPLESFKSEILNNTGIISRQEFKWNLYLNDRAFRTYQNPQIITKSFPSGFNTLEFVLSVAGGQ